MPCLRNRIVYKSTLAISRLYLKILIAYTGIAYRNDPEGRMLKLQIDGLEIVLLTDSVRKALYKNHKYE